MNKYKIYSYFIFNKLLDTKMKKYSKLHQNYNTKISKLQNREEILVASSKIPIDNLLQNIFMELNFAN